jgi:PKD repeat protein
MKPKPFTLKARRLLTILLAVSLLLSGGGVPAALAALPEGAGATSSANSAGDSAALLASSWLELIPVGPPAPVSEETGEETGYQVGLLPVQSGAVSSTIAYDPYIAGMIDQVQTERIIDLMLDLTGERPAIIDGQPYTINTRYTLSGTPIQKATQYVGERFLNQGLDVEYHVWNASRPPNVIGQLDGIDQPERLVLITAHMDSVPNYGNAPGADDNASGTTGVIIAAEILSQYQWDCTLRFVAFTGEEQGLLGSAAYANRSFSLGEQIAGVVNMDMISYNNLGGPIVDLHARSAIPASVALANLYSNVVTTYGINLVPDILINYTLGNYSDNKSFWDRGYSAILVIEDNDDFTPYYHTVNDRLSTLNLGYFTNNVKASLGTLAHMGCLRPPVGVITGTVVDASTQLPLTGAEVVVSSETTQWTAQTGPDGSYQFSLDPGTYSIAVSFDGYQGGDAVVEIAAYETSVIDFQLVPFPLSGLSVEFWPIAPQGGEVVTFAASVTGGQPITYTWDFGDGSDPVSGSGLAQVEHTFPYSAEAQDYTVSLQVENPVSLLSTQFVVSVEPLEALGPLTITFTPAQPQAGDVVTFTADVSGGFPITYSWDFGDGSGPVSGEDAFQVAHLFPDLYGANSYTVTLAAANPVSTIQAEVSVTVTGPDQELAILAADLLWEPLEITAGEPVTFTAVITGGVPTTWTWSFGDGTDPVSGADLDQMTHTFPLNDEMVVYTVTLQVENGVSSVTVNRPVQVLRVEPQAKIYELFMPIIVITPDEVVFDVSVNYYYTISALPAARSFQGGLFYGASIIPADLTSRAYPGQDVRAP